MKNLKRPILETIYTLLEQTESLQFESETDTPLRTVKEIEFNHQIKLVLIVEEDHDTITIHRNRE